MKKPAKSAKSSIFAPGEHIRVVPLHHPKPAFTIDDLSRARRGPEPDDGELFDGKAHAIPANAHLTYNGGPLIPNVEVYTIFWGKLWGTTPASVTMLSRLNSFFQAILASPLIDQLQEYSVAGQAIGHGTLTGSKTIRTNAPVGSITDSAIQKQLKAWIVGGIVPKPNKNTLYFIYLDPGIVSIMGGAKSCQNYCGYHNHVGTTYYAVMPYPTCNGCLGGMNALDALTGTSSHELYEAITDPIPGGGWYDNVNGEIGDICAWNFKTVAGYKVQLEWSNAQNKCV
jgi:hypothetical protein